MSELMANLEGIDSPSTHSSSSSDNLESAPTVPVHPHTDNPLPRRISRLGPVILQPCAEAGPSKGGQRYMYIGVRSGERPTVYTDWKQAEAELLVCRRPPSVTARLMIRTTQTLSSRPFPQKWLLMRISKGGMALVDTLYR